MRGGSLSGTWEQSDDGSDEDLVESGDEVEGEWTSQQRGVVKASLASVMSYWQQAKVAVAQDVEEVAKDTSAVIEMMH
jgi:hypothetical protein